jgi:3-oxoadipate enol-lactonase
LKRTLLNTSLLIAIVLLLYPADSHASLKSASLTTGIAEVNGTKLFYEMAGKGRVVVLIHGGLADSRLWDDQFREFARHYRVIRYDLRGFGKSAFPTTPYSHVEDLAALLKFLKVEKASLVGLSLGGIIAVEFTLAHPEMVQSLILSAAGLRGYQGGKNEQALAVYKAAEEPGGKEKAIAMWLEHPFFATGRNNPLYQQRMRQMLSDNFKYWGPTPQPIVVNWPTPQPSIERLSDIKARTLIIVGDRDFQNILAIADILKEKIAGAQKVVIEGVSHHLNMEKPKEFNRVVLGFLSKA